MTIDITREAVERLAEKLNGHTCEAYCIPASVTLLALLGVIDRLQDLLFTLRNTLDNAERERDEALEALREIAEQDIIELTLDPEWPQRIARAILAKHEGKL